MSIEFPCSQCGKLLRVGDEAAGKQARCPSCGVVQDIPASTLGVQSPFGVAPPPPSAMPVSQGDFNPYQAPVSSAWQPPVSAALQVQPIDASDVLNRTWIIFKSQFWMITITTFVWWIIQAAFGAVAGQIVTRATVGAAGGQPDDTAILISQVIVQVLGFLLGTWMEAGMAIYMLKTARGESAGLGDLFAGSPTGRRRFLPDFSASWPSSSAPRY